MKIKMALLLFTVCLIFSGCGFSEPKCTVEIITSYSGYGIDGQKLESGTFSEAFTVTEGDVFYEGNDGKWILNPKDGDKYVGVIAEILEVGDDGVTALIHGEEKLTIYGRKRNISAGFIVYDGPSYEYVMTVSECSE